MKQFRGVGAIILSEQTNKVMTVLRSSSESHPYTWTFAGGKVESDENLLDALKRELQEELQLTKIKKIIPLHSYQRRSKDFIYETYIALVSKEFIPELNEENIGYAWTNIDCLPNPIHPKTKQMLNSKRLKEKLKNFYNWMDKKNGKNNTIS